MVLHGFCMEKGFCWEKSADIVIFSPPGARDLSVYPWDGREKPITGPRPGSTSTTGGRGSLGLNWRGEVRLQRVRPQPLGRATREACSPVRGGIHMPAPDDRLVGANLDRTTGPGELLFTSVAVPQNPAADTVKLDTLARFGVGR